jgi:hypothetical protein
MYPYLRESYSPTKNYLKTANASGNAVLKKETSEPSDLYSARIDRCPIRNHIGLIVDRYHSSAISTSVERDSGWKDLWSNYSEVFHDALKEAQIVGKCYVVASLNNAETQNNIDLRVFMVAVDCVLEYIPNEIFAFKDGEYTIIYTTDGAWRKIKGEETVEVGVSGFNILPVIEINPRFPGISQVGLLAPIQETLINYLSLQIEEALGSNFTRYAIGNLSEIPQTEVQDRAVQRMIAGKRLLLFKDNISVTDMSGNIGQSSNLLEIIKNIEEMLYAVAGLRLSEPIALSGIAKRLEMQQFVDIRNKLVKALEEAENAFIDLLKTVFGDKWAYSAYNYDTIKASWPERIAELKDLLTLGLEESFIGKVKKRFQDDYLLEEE